MFGGAPIVAFCVNLQGSRLVANRPPTTDGPRLLSVESPLSLELMSDPPKSRGTLYGQSTCRADQNIGCG